MGRFLVLGFVIVFSSIEMLAQEYSPPNRPIPYPVIPPKAYQRAVEKSTRSKGMPGQKYWMNTAQYKLTARLFPDLKKLEGRATITYFNNSPDTLRQLWFSLVQNYHRESSPKVLAATSTPGVLMKAVICDGVPAATRPPAQPRYFVNGTLGQVTPQLPVPPGGKAVIGMEWEFEIPQNGAGGRMGYDTDSLFYLAYWYPQMNTYDDVAGWQNDQFLGLGEFYSDFADYDVSLEVPEGWIVQSTGTLQNPAEVYSPMVQKRLAEAIRSDTAYRILHPSEYSSATVRGKEGWLRWHFTAQRVRDMAWTATRHSIWESGRTAVVDDKGKTKYVMVHAFWRPGETRWVNAIKYMQHAVTFYSSYTGIPYPWPHMTAVEAAAIIGGGMEYPMMTLIGSVKNFPEATFYEFLSHEIAHMWVPMIVSTDERRYGWMDEGYTAFHTEQALKDFNPEWKNSSPFPQAYLAFARSGGDEEIYRRMDYYYSLAHLGSLMYGKPSLGLSMLRSVIGEERFNNQHRRFLTTWAWKHPYPWDMFQAYTPDDGKSMDWFFRPWYFDNWVIDHAVGEVNTTASGTVITVHDKGLMPLPAHVTATFSDSTTTTLVVPVDEWLKGKTNAAVTVPGSKKVIKVELDKYKEYPDVEKTNNSWILK